MTVSGAGTAGAVGDTKRAARHAADSPWFRALARVGFAASGLLHLVLGWIVIQIGIGSGDAKANQDGALSTIAQAPGGRFLLWVCVIGFAALGLWQAVRAVVGTTATDRSDRTKDRLKSAARAVLYLVLGYLALQYATGTSGSGKGSKGTTAQLLANPLGQALVVLAGASIVGVAVYHVHKGWKKKFLEDLRTTGGGAAGRSVITLGRVGYIAKGVALGVLGVLVVVAGLTADAEKASGLDAAFATIGSSPLGGVLLVLTGIGFAAFGAYSFARARYARL